MVNNAGESDEEIFAVSDDVGVFVYIDPTLARGVVAHYASPRLNIEFVAMTLKLSDPLR